MIIPSVVDINNLPHPLLGNTDGSQPVGGFTTEVSATPAITAGAYTAGKEIGGLISLFNATRVGMLTGIVQTITITDKAKQNAAIDVVFFVVNPTNSTFTDNVTLAVANQDLVNARWVSVGSSNYTSFSANSVATLPNVGLRFKLAVGTTLYCALVNRGTPTYATTSDITLVVGIDQD